MNNLWANLGGFISRNKPFAITILIVAVVAIVVGTTGKGGGVIPQMMGRGTLGYGASESDGFMGMPGVAVESYDASYNSRGGVMMAYSKGVATPSVSPMPPIYDTPASSATVPADKKIIRNGSLNLLVKGAETASSEISKIAEANDGFVENSNIYEVSEGVKSGSISIRVPSKNFNTVMEAIKAIAVKVTNENVSSNDVTAQYVDLEAQVKNYRAEEKQYQEIMARAVKIEDILNVASRLADVRGRIERTEGQLNYLSRQVDMSTINVSLTAEPEVKVFGIVWRPLTVLKQAFKSMLTELTGFIDWLIRFIFMIPVYILRIAVIAIVICVLWKIILIVKRKMFPQVQ